MRSVLFRLKLPPWNVAILCTVWMALSVLLLIAVGPKPQPLPTPSPPDPNCAFDCDGLPFFSIWDSGIAPYTIGIGVALLVSSLSAAVGIRIGQICLLVSIVLFTIWIPLEGIAIIRLLGHLELLGAFRAWLSDFRVWDVLSSLAWFAWVGLNFFCFLGTRARQFYANDA